MVVRIQHHLSLFLVVTLTTSWFVLPQTILAQSTGSTSTSISSTDPCIQKKYNASTDATIHIFTFKVGGRPITLTSLPPYQHRCFVQLADGSLLHNFRYDHTPQVQAANTIFNQQYKKVTDIPVYAGCDSTKDRTCTKDTPDKYNYFTFYTAGVTYDGIGSTGSAGTGAPGAVTQDRRETFPEAKAELYYFTKSIDPDGRGADPNAFLIVYNGTSYGFFGMNRTYLEELRNRSAAERQQIRTNNIKRKIDDFAFLQPEAANLYRGSLSNPRARPIHHYIALVNGLNGTAVLQPAWGSTSRTVNAITTFEGIKRLFYTVTNDIDKSLTAGTGDIDLLDNPADTTGDTNKDSSPDPVLPPILRISRGKLPIDQDLALTLIHVVRSPERVKERNNNYFLFSPDVAKLTPLQKEVLNNYGIDPNLLYVAVDVGGNILFLGEDKNKAGGIFATGKGRLDPSPEANLIAIGSPDGNKAQASTNLQREALNINLDQYRAIITKRVYNNIDYGSLLESILDPLTIDAFHCIEDPLVNYPELNTSYDARNPAVPWRIPIGQARKCINPPGNPDSWLGKWGLRDTRIDENPADDCTRSFEKSSPIGKAMGGALCFMVKQIITGAVWFAGFTVYFLIESVGLQYDE